MSDLKASLALAASGMKAQSFRLRLSAENISNSDTPGYRRKLTSFENVLGNDGLNLVRTGRVQLDQGDLPSLYDPAHPMADDAGYYEGSNVDLMVEIADSREAQRSYEANLRMFDQTRQMSSSLLELLRR